MLLAGSCQTGAQMRDEIGPVLCPLAEGPGAGLWLPGEGVTFSNLCKESLQAAPTGNICFNSVTFSQQLRLPITKWRGEGI